ncbi:MAG: KH domain-containing protein [Methanocellales archaeon]|nr:KH domain-containing protein [Methanocellales archaeon]MDD3291317.1 KH domain-containing protein [Methanocellales archaeon]MDD5235811.1 KH domain-containing protein [Methanocellales archaeon]MDD5484428.1 KH domain-containing protein [Methanocellales archaeon]
MYVKVPLDRVGVIIGANGSTKSIIEKLGVNLNIDSKLGSVQINSSDSLKEMTAGEVIKAIGRGFSPERALSLLEDEMLMLDTIDLSKMLKAKKDIIRVKGRIIGKGGRTRELMETLTGAKISVYAKTVGIIGTPDQIQIVRRGIEMLIRGAPHAPVYGYLEKQKKERDIQEILG